MAGTIRHITDGEEAVLSASEPFVLRAPVAAAGIRVESARKGSTAIEYLGFQNVGDRREYVLQTRQGTEARRYTVSIELAAFSRRQALLQEGPDICYQKLARELADPDLAVSEGIAITDADLEAYRATHSVAKRR